MILRGANAGEIAPTRLKSHEKIGEQFSQPLLGSMESTRMTPGQHSKRYLLLEE
jgi:hypothetical protein